MSEELVAAERGGVPALRASGVMAVAMMSEADFERRLAALKVGQARMARIQREMMTEDEDFGVIPGTAKPTLLKPGAEKLCQAYGLTPTFTRQILEGDGVSRPHLRVVTDCRLHLGDADGPVVGSGAGAANSWERKHRYRNQQRACPSCGVIGSIKRSKFAEGEQAADWYCYDKAGGCGAKFVATDRAIVGQDTTGQVDNPDPYDLENTLIKMSEKRAYIDATLRATATSGLFTQDLEDQEERKQQQAVSPTRQTAHEAAGAADGSTLVKDVTEKSGKSAKGPWTYYDVVFADGRKGRTFSEALGAEAKVAKGSQARVWPAIEQGEKGMNLKSLGEAPSPATPIEPDEPVMGPEKILTVRTVKTAAGPRWIVQTEKRQVVTDEELLATMADEARKTGIGLVPAFKVVSGRGGSVNKLSGWEEPAATDGDAAGGGE